MGGGYLETCELICLEFGSEEFGVFARERLVRGIGMNGCLETCDVRWLEFGNEELGLFVRE